MFAPRLELAPELGYLFPMKYGAHCYLFTRSWSDASLPLLGLDLVIGPGGLWPDGGAFVEKGIAFLRALEARIIDPARRRP
jgi:hypothetical protein